MFGPGDNSNSKTAPEKTARVAKSIMLAPSSQESPQINRLSVCPQKIVLDTFITISNTGRTFSVLPSFLPPL
jgi:hypothetical protein